MHVNYDAGFYMLVPSSEIVSQIYYEYFKLDDTPKVFDTNQIAQASVTPFTLLCPNDDLPSRLWSLFVPMIKCISTCLFLHQR